jgi:hypothetical protein
MNVIGLSWVGLEMEMELVGDGIRSFDSYEKA